MRSQETAAWPAGCLPADKSWTIVVRWKVECTSSHAGNPDSIQSQQRGRRYIDIYQDKPHLVWQTDTESGHAHAYQSLTVQPNFPLTTEPRTTLPSPTTLRRSTRAPTNTPTSARVRSQDPDSSIKFYAVTPAAAAPGSSPTRPRHGAMTDNWVNTPASFRCRRAGRTPQFRYAPSECSEVEPRRALRRRAPVAHLNTDAEAPEAVVVAALPAAAAAAAAFALAAAARAPAALAAAARAHAAAAAAGSSRRRRRRPSRRPARRPRRRRRPFRRGRRLRRRRGAAGADRHRLRGAGRRGHRRPPAADAL